MSERSAPAVDADLVARLVAEQCPSRADSTPVPVASAGTDNALFRLGDDLVARLPRVAWAASQPEREHRWLPYLAPLLPLPIPEPVFLGEPGCGYPWHWAMHRWMPGRNATEAPIADPVAAADTLAGFVCALSTVDASDGPLAGRHNVGRGMPLAPRDPSVRKAVAAMGTGLDADAVLAVWDGALAAPAWQGAPVWVHGDIHGGNLLVADGAVTAVIDFGTLGVGDPAVDLLVAWYLFDGDARAAFRDAVQADDASWLRGRGWALSMAVIGLPYYLDRNPAFVAEARRVIASVLADEF